MARDKQLSPKAARKARKREEAKKGAPGRIILVGDNQAPQHNHNRVLEKDGSINVSQSKVRAWRDCRRAYHNKYALGLRKKKIKRPFMFGTIMHSMAEADLKGLDPFKVLSAIELDNKKMFKREIEMYGNIIEDLRDIMTEYFKQWEGELKPIKGPDGQLAEHQFSIEIAKALYFTGKIDAIGKARRLKWLVEHKTFNRMPSEDDRWRSVQGAVYFKALYELGYGAIDGVLWDYIWSKPPSVPTEMLLNGTYSLKKINSLPSRLKRWVKDEGLKKGDYKKLFDEAAANRASYFKRVYSPVKPRVVDSLWDGFLETAKEIQQDHGIKKAQNVGRHCSWCDYQPLCKAEATGADVEFVMKREYTTEEEDRITVDQQDREE